jgi:thiamine biosynthesis protein ThiS
MQLVINGETTEVPAELNLAGLLEHLQLQGDRVAVELNRQIVRRDYWASTLLRDHDRLEIVHFVGGG